MWGQVMWEEDPARDGRPGSKLPSAVWPHTKSFHFWTLVYFFVNENISTIVSVAGLFVTGLEDRNRRLWAYNEIVGNILIWSIKVSAVQKWVIGNMGSLVLYIPFIPGTVAWMYLELTEVFEKILTSYTTTIKREQSSNSTLCSLHAFLFLILARCRLAVSPEGECFLIEVVLFLSSF